MSFETVSLGRGCPAAGAFINRSGTGEGAFDTIETGKWVRQPMAHETSTGPVTNQEPKLEIEPTHSPDRVDLTLIRWMLSLTPAERLQVLQQSVWRQRSLLNCCSQRLLPRVRVFVLESQIWNL